MALKDEIKKAVAANLREFGYPDCSADNVTSTKLFAMFARTQIEDFGDKHEDKPDVQAAVKELLAECDTATERSNHEA